MGSYTCHGGANFPINLRTAVHLGRAPLESKRNKQKKASTCSIHTIFIAGTLAGASLLTFHLHHHHHSPVLPCTNNIFIRHTLVLLFIGRPLFGVSMMDGKRDMKIIDTSFAFYNNLVRLHCVLLAAGGTDAGACWSRASKPTQTNHGPTVPLARLRLFFLGPYEFWRSSPPLAVLHFIIASVCSMHTSEYNGAHQHFGSDKRPKSFTGFMTSRKEYQTYRTT